MEMYHLPEKLYRTETTIIAFNDNNYEYALELYKLIKWSKKALFIDD